MKETSVNPVSGKPATATTTVAVARSAHHQDPSPKKKEAAALPAASVLSVALIHCRADPSLTHTRPPVLLQRQMKEYLVRLMYCEMLGHEAEFGYIHAVKLAQHASILEKRIGYLAVSVLLHEDHELMVLLINTLQRDLRSTNVVEICTALTTISRVMNAEMIPAILPLVEEKCTHAREIVRKKVKLWFCGREGLCGIQAAHFWKRCAAAGRPSPCYLARLLRGCDLGLELPRSLLPCRPSSRCTGSTRAARPASCTWLRRSRPRSATRTLG